MTGTGRIVWLASYPKSGNTWMRLALASLRLRGGAIDINRLRDANELGAASRMHFDLLAEVDSSDLTHDEIQRARPAIYRQMSDGMSDPGLFKTHDAFVRVPGGAWLFPKEATLGAVLIVRDPRDVAVSTAHAYDRDIDAVIAQMADPHARLATGRLLPQVPQTTLDWSGHARSWLDAPGMDTILVRYEDMLADLASELARIAPLLDLPRTPAALAGAVEATRFDHLRAEEERHGFRERQPKAERFFREGRSGGWREALSADQARRIAHDHGEMMERLGYLPEA